MPAAPSRFLLDATLDAPGEYALGRQESHHAVNVMRCRVGEAVTVFDGLGKYAEAVVVAMSRDALLVRVGEIRQERHLPLMLTIATAIPKGKRWQALVEKCTELGVDRIIPLLTERSVAKGEGDADKWRRWIIEAAKQSRRSWLPEITEPMDVAEVVEMAQRDDVCLLLADPEGESPRTYRELLQKARQAITLIGPEGGFSAGEMAFCQERGAKTLCVSPFVLRVETAASAVCAIIREVLL